MASFKQLISMAAHHHGGPEAVLEKIQNTYAQHDMSAMTDDRWLAEMTRAVFNAGFNWKVIEAKWEGFEAAFEGFDPHRIAFYSDDDLARLVSDERVVRNGQKLKATIENARFVVETSKEHGSFGKFLADWPPSDQIGLLDHLSKNGSRLGGATAQYFLRFSGWDAFILSKDVSAALIRDEVIDKPPTSKKAMKAVQEAFNALVKESGRSQAEISRLLAMSVG